MTGTLKSAPRRCLIGALLLVGCAPPEEAPVISRPDALPVRNITDFSEALRCMDNLFVQFGVRDIVITSAGLPDATGEITTGTKDTLISAISRMSATSGAFRFVDFDQFQADALQPQSLVGLTEDSPVPNYDLRGAIFQRGEGAIADNVGGSPAGAASSPGSSAEEVVGVVSMDLSIGNPVTRQILPGLSAHNSLAVIRNGRAGDTRGQIQSYGRNFDLSLERAEGMQAAVRSLVELSTIEVLGKLAQVPYWRCLAIEQTNPAVVVQAREWFDAMAEHERIVFVQRALASAGYFEAPITGEPDAATRGAVARYQADNDLIADGRINFDLYASLIHQDLAIGRQPDPLAGQAVQAAAVRPDPPALTVATPKGAEPTYRVSETLKLTLVASQDAYVYCYYRDGSGSIARIYPNQFQPDAYVEAGRPVEIPGAGAGFDIVFESPGVTEEVACLASRLELGLRLPPQLRVEGLRPMPVESMDQVVSSFQQLDGASLIARRMPIRVTN